VTGLEEVVKNEEGRGREEEKEPKQNYQEKDGAVVVVKVPEGEQKGHGEPHLNRGAKRVVGLGILRVQTSFQWGDVGFWVDEGGGCLLFWFW